VTSDERLQVFANALKLFTDESASAVKALAQLDVLPDKLTFGPEGYVILSDPNDLSAYVQIAAVEGRPFYWEVSGRPHGETLTPVQLRALRRYGFVIPSGDDQNPRQEWPRARAQELPAWMERIFREVFNLPADTAVTLSGGV